MRRNKRWFGPFPALRWRVIYPVSWQGWAVTVAVLLGIVTLKFVDDPVRRAVALALLVGGYCLVVVLTWGRDPD